MDYKFQKLKLYEVFSDVYYQ